MDLTSINVEAERSPRVKKDYSKLRERQLDVILSEKFREKGGQIRDDNPPGYIDRTYAELAKIKMPLILDQIQRKAWTINEILSAMQPAINALAGKYSGKRAAFQTDEAESLGKEAVLTALWTDLGLAWFAGYCYEKIEAAIRRGAKTSGTIKASERRREYRDKVRSTDESIGEGDGTIAETIRDTTPIIRRERCGDYYKVTIHQRLDIYKAALPILGLEAHTLKQATDFLKAEVKKSTKAEDQEILRGLSQNLRTILVKDQIKKLDQIFREAIKEIGEKVVKGTTGAIFSPTCRSGILPSGEVCDRCGGTGLTTIYEDRVVRSPADLAAERIRQEEFRRVFQDLTQDLSPRQIEILMLREGLDEGGYRRTASEIAEILREKDRVEQVQKLMAEGKSEEDARAQAGVGMMSKNRVSQVLEIAYAKLRKRQGTSKILTEAIDRILDESDD